MSALVVDLDTLVPAGTRTLAGPDLGRRVRAAAGLDAADLAGRDVVVRIPGSVWALSTSFFLAAFGPSWRHRGGPRFRRAYRFHHDNPALAVQIAQGIERCRLHHAAPPTPPEPPATDRLAAAVRWPATRTPVRHAVPPVARALRAGIRRTGLVPTLVCLAAASLALQWPVARIIDLAAPALPAPVPGVLAAAALALHAWLAASILAAATPRALHRGRPAARR